MANKTINGLTVEIGGDTKKLGAAIDEADKKSRQLSSELGEINKLLKFNEANPELLAQKQQILTAQIEQTKNKLEMLRQAQAQATAAFARGEVSEEQMRALQREIIATEGRLTHYQTAVEDTKDKIQKLGSSEQALSSVTQETAYDMDELGTASDEAGAGMSTAAVAVGTFIGNLALDVLKSTVSTLKDMTAAVIEQVGATAEYGDGIDKMSQKLGMSAEAYQEWDFIMQHSGSDIDKMTTAAKKLADAVAEPTASTTAAFEKLGISMDAAAEMSQEDLFSAVITQLQGMESGAERTALANGLLGKSAIDLGALLNASAEDTAAMRQQIHDLGGVLSDDAVKASARYQDSLQDLQVSVSGTARGFAAQLLPSVADAMDGLSAILSGDSDGFEFFSSGIETTADLIPEILTEMTDRINEILPELVSLVGKTVPEIAETVLPQIVDLANQIVRDLLPLIPKLLQSLLPTLLSWLLQLIVAISRQAPDILRSLMQIAGDILTELSAVLPELLTVFAGEIVPELILVLLDGLPDLIDCGITLLTALVSALPEIIVQIVAVLPQLIDSITAALLVMVPQLMQCGITLLTALVQALPQIIQAICAVLPQIVTSAVSALIALLPMLIDCGIELFLALIGALPEIISAIMDAMPQIVDGIMTALVAMYPQLIQYGYDLLLSLIERLSEVNRKIADAAQKIVETLRDAIRSRFESIRQLGKNLVEGLWNGIQDMAGWIHDKIIGFGEGILDSLKRFFGIASPSRVFRDQIGKNLSLGLAEGIAAESETAIDAMQNMADDIADVEFQPRQIDFRRITSPEDNPFVFERSLQAQFSDGSAEPQITVMDPTVLSRLDSILRAIERGQVLYLDGDAFVGGTIDRINTGLGVIEATEQRR